MLSYKRVLMAVPYRYVNEETVKQGVSFARHHQVRVGSRSVPGLMIL